MFIVRVLYLIKQKEEKLNSPNDCVISKNDIKYD